MIKKANINWSAKQLVKMIIKGTINFDNSVQRGYCWDVKRKSLLISSMLIGYPIPAFYSAKTESGYDMFDGKQRSNAIAEYINNKYALENVPEVMLESEELIDVTGMKFLDLPEELQDAINSYSLTIYYFDGITEDEITEMFSRLNNGKPLSAIELTRVKAKSFETIKGLGKHQLFNSVLSEKAINKYTNEDIVIKSYAILFKENPSFETKYIRPLMEESDITEEQSSRLTIVYDNFLSIYNSIQENESKDAQKVSKRILTRTHLLSLIYIINNAIDNEVSIDDIIDFALEFFNGKKNASINEIYNSTISSGASKTDSIKKRYEALMDDYNKFIAAKKIVDIMQ